MSEDDRKIMGTPEAATAALIAKTKRWRELRQPIMGTRKQIASIDVLEREARFQLANAALHWLWHQENPSP